jgi:hypothetical protein
MSFAVKACLFRLLIALTTLAGASLYAQQSTSPVAKTPTNAPPTNATTKALTNTASSAKPSPVTQPAEDKRLQEILKLQFDRRPAAILKALAKKAEGPAVLTNEAQRFEMEVVAGDWKAVKEFLAKLPEKQVPQIYKHLLQSLLKIPQPTQPQPTSDPSQPQPPQSNQPIEPVLLPQDILGLADARPGELQDSELELLGRLLARALAKGAGIEPFMTQLESGTENLGGPDPKKRARAATLLMAANRLVEAGKFLPSIDALIGKKDYAGIDLQARYLIASSQEKGASAPLRRAWELTQMVLTDKTAPATNREQALTRALELMPLLSKELGRDWLRENFQKSPEQGMSILAAVGAVVAQEINSFNAEKRRKNLELQRRAVDELLGVVGKEPKSWEGALNVMALSWLQEAERSKLHYQPPRQQPYQQIVDYDPYGNPIYSYSGYNPYNPPQPPNPNEPPPISIDKLLPSAPGDAWLAAMDKSVLLKTRGLMAELYLKLEQEEKALPWIEALAPDQPKVALNLANETLRTWSRSRNPNPIGQGYQRYYSGGVYYSSYGGYGMNMPGIPLTRALQVRNLKQLSALLERLRRLPGGELDERAVVSAFTASHSPAEVFRLEDIEMVLGKPDEMKGATLGELLQSMRERLARQWRMPTVQQQNKTKRTDKDIQAEVNRGYELVIGLTEKAVETRPNDWRLWMVNGAAHFDWAEYAYGKQEKLAIYTQKRDKAFEMLQKAAALYSEQVSMIEEEKQTPMVFQQWFNAALGASDLAFLTRQQRADTNRIDQIRDALLALPSETVERHVATFGRGLAESINGLPPELKPRYLKAGLRIVGDHESAEEARKLVTYYDGLLEEVQFHARIDGDANVGHGRPFGIHLAIQHSEAVGRESGGFAKYLMNQQSITYYYNPMGGAPVNYRDDLEKKIRETLHDGFEILSITFHDEKVEPRGYGRQGWRETPIAYALAKAKDASVDRIPAIQLDLDFLDRRGKVVLPVESPIVQLDARTNKPPARPLTDLSVTQTLDDRELAKGKVMLEVKAMGKGIIPELNELFDLRLAGFMTNTITDHGLTISKLDTEGDSVAPVGERDWLIELVQDAKAGVAKLFHFPTPRLETKELAFKRYADADIVDVKESVALSGLPLRPPNYWNWVLGSLVFVGCGVGLYFLLRPAAHQPTTAVTSYALPPHITPFTVLTLLRRIEQDEGLALPSSRRAELGLVIHEVERRFFGPGAETNGQADLERIAREWVSRAS